MLRVSLAVAPFLCASTALADNPPQYMVQVIGGLDQPPASGLISMPLGLNNNGRTVGYAATSASQSQILNWKGGAPSVVTPVPGTNRSFGSKVNILGRIAGAAYVTDSSGAILQSRAVYWRGLVPQQLGTLGGLNAAALGINDSDRVVGYSTLAGESQVRAFQWANGVMLPLPTPAGATQTYAYDISNNNHIVGVYAGSFPARPVMWQNGQMVQLAIPGWSRTGQASAVNDAGVAVGNYEINQANGTFAAVAWSGGQRLELGNLGGPFPYAVASDINNRGQIVGTSNSANGYTGFVWINGQMYDLRSRLVAGSPDVQITSALAINDFGQIAAAAVVGGRTTAILLIPVTDSTPSPGSLSLLGAFGLLAWRRRR